MIRAYHTIFTTYGFWLPNDPRGSWSDFVRSWELFEHGRARKTTERRSLAGNHHDVAKRKSAKSSLRYPAVVFDGTQAMQCIQGFAAAIDRSGHTLHACSILPDHVHVVVRRHWHQIEQIVGQFKGEATKRLIQAGLHPLSEFVDANSGPLPRPWARKCWKVFLNSDEQIRCAIRYVEQNPVQDSKRPQRWSFVVPFESA